MSVGATIAIGAGIATIGTAVVKLVLHYRKQPEPGSPLARLKAKHVPLDLEVVALRFVVSLNNPIPSVLITLRAINYLKRPLHLERVDIEYFHINRAPALEHIPCEDYELEPSQSREVYCRRSLLDSEAKALADVPADADMTASIRLRATGTAGKKRVEYRPGATYSLSGVIERPPRQLPPKST